MGNFSPQILSHPTALCEELALVEETNFYARPHLEGPHHRSHPLGREEAEVWNECVIGDGAQILQEAAENVQLQVSPIGKRIQQQAGSITGGASGGASASRRSGNPRST